MSRLYDHRCMHLVHAGEEDEEEHQKRLFNRTRSAMELCFGWISVALLFFSASFHSSWASALHNLSDSSGTELSTAPPPPLHILGLMVPFRHAKNLAQYRRDVVRPHRVLRLFLVAKIPKGCVKFFLMHLTLPLSTITNGKRRRMGIRKMCLRSGEKYFFSLMKIL